MDFSPEPFLKMRSQMPSEAACSFSNQLRNSAADLKVSIFKRFLARLVSEVPRACRHLAPSASANNVDVEVRMSDDTPEPHPEREEHFRPARVRDVAEIDDAAGL